MDRMSRRLLAARVVAVLVAVLVGCCQLVGVRAAAKDRAAVDRGVAAMQRGPAGMPVFEVKAVPEAFLRYAVSRIPPHDPVSYVRPGVDLCARGGTPTRVWGVVYWTQYRLAPRPTVCAGARWRVYLGAPVPDSVRGADRWSATLAVEQVGGR
jgi:hypothetical protein